MQKLITILFAISLIFESSKLMGQCSSINSVKVELNWSDLEIMGLSGKVDSVFLFQYEINSNYGQISKGEKKCELLMVFNRDGSLKKTITYDSNIAAENTDIYEYENGLIKLIRKYNHSGKLNYTTVFVKEGNDVREQEYNFDGKPQNQYTVRTYDNNKNIIRSEWKYNEESESQKSKSEYFYGNNNRINKVITNGKRISTPTYEKNDSKLPIKIETIMYVDTQLNKIDRIVIDEYDSYFNHLNRYSRNKLLYSSVYTYDDKNNWIKRINYSTEALIPRSIIERKIIYFE